MFLGQLFRVFQSSIISHQLFTMEAKPHSLRNKTGNVETDQARDKAVFADGGIVTSLVVDNDRKWTGHMWEDNNTEFHFRTSEPCLEGTPALLKRAALVSAMHELPNPHPPPPPTRKAPQQRSSSPTIVRRSPSLLHGPDVPPEQASILRDPSCHPACSAPRLSSTSKVPFNCFVVVDKWLLISGCSFFSGLILKFKSFHG